MKRFWRQGEHFVWLSGITLSVILLITLILIGVVIQNGLGVFWPHAVFEAVLQGDRSVMGEVVKREKISDTDRFRLQFKTGNRDLYGIDFRWVPESDIKTLTRNKEAVVLERTAYGNFYGFIDTVSTPDQPVSRENTWSALLRAQGHLRPLQERVRKIEKEIKHVSHAQERNRLKQQKWNYRGVDESDPKMIYLHEAQKKYKEQFDRLLDQQKVIERDIAGYTVTLTDVEGRKKTIPLSHIVNAHRPNQMSRLSKVTFYIKKVGLLFIEEPRESNTEGGLFPAIFGTVMLVFLMSFLSFPLGVLAGIYLREYAREWLMVRTVRIAVNNLAGIPSIVYGVFGLGFFIYGIGGTLDQLFFPERLPTPTFGTGGLLWASLTLGLLTVPVVIVATEEAFGAIPQGVREASMALGATKLQTLIRVLFPMASPGIMTGFILAMARAAGEVAPLMITGVVKLAPALPVDGTFPFFHLDRKFMHLGFHIYDIGFQSPNVEAAKPMVFVTTLLLVLVVLFLTSAAILLRNRMKKRYTMGAF